MSIFERTQAVGTARTREEELEDLLYFQLVPRMRYTEQKMERMLAGPFGPDRVDHLAALAKRYGRLSRVADKVRIRLGAVDLEEVSFPPLMAAA